MEQLHYPLAGQAKAYMEEMAQQQAQRQMQMQAQQMQMQQAQAVQAQQQQGQASELEREKAVLEVKRQAREDAMKAIQQQNTPPGVT